MKKIVLICMFVMGCSAKSHELTVDGGSDIDGGSDLVDYWVGDPDFNRRLPLPFPGQAVDGGSDFNPSDDAGALDNDAAVSASDAAAADSGAAGDGGAVGNGSDAGAPRGPGDRLICECWYE